MKFQIIILLILLLIISACQSNQEVVIIIDCGDTTIQNCNDGDCMINECFLNATQTCTPAKTHITTSENILGIEHFITVKTEIKGMSEDSCLVHNEIMDYDVILTNDFKERLKDAGLSESEIMAYEQENIDAGKLYVGLEGNCSYLDDELYLKIYDKGYYAFSFDDGENFNCTGAAYEIYDAR